MHTAVRRYVNVDDPDEVVRRIKEEGFVDIIRGVRGFIDYIVIDDGGGVLVTISTSFEDRYGAEESTTVAMEWLQGHDLARCSLPRRRSRRARPWCSRKGRPNTR